MGRPVGAVPLDHGDEIARFVGGRAGQRIQAGLITGGELAALRRERRAMAELEALYARFLHLLALRREMAAFFDGELAVLRSRQERGLRLQVLAHRA